MQNLIIKKLGTCKYQDTWDEMKAITDQRDADTPDELWLLQHPPVFTQGLAGKPEHVLNQSDIPIVQTDRGGQVTYHGPGQLVAYVLFDIRRLKMGVRQLVQMLEACVIDVLAEYNVKGETQCKAPGVYVNGAKICSIGLRVRKGCSYHGIAFNIDMDLAPFAQINPCGFQGLQMLQLSDFVKDVTLAEVGDKFAQAVVARFGFH
jgi:lipoyl(octanoyl) transferase